MNEYKMNNQKYTHQITCVYCSDTIFIGQCDTYKLADGWKLGVNNRWGDGICPECDKILKERREKALDELTKQAQDLDMGY